jgi:hypothetical protein
MNIKKLAKKLGKKVDRYRLDAQDVATLGASRSIGKALGGRMNAKTLIGRLPNGLKPNGRIPKGETHEAKGFPGVLGKATACATVHPDGSIKRPYVYIGRITLSAGAQAINTDLGDFLDAANGDDIGTDNVVPFGLSIEQASLQIGTTLVASAIEHVGNLGGCYVIFRVNGVEEARWPITKFNPTYSAVGVVTSGGAATVVPVEYNPVPFAIDFDPDKTYELALRTTKAFTTVGVVELALALEGQR